MTVLDLVTRTLQDLQVLQKGEVPDGDDAALGLATLNDWIDALAPDGLSMYTVTRTTWTISTAASYTIGSGGTINVPRPTGPQAIVQIGYQDTSVSPTLETLQGPVLTEADYAAIPQKAITSVYPTAWYYNPTFGTTGLGTLKPWPVPSGTTLQGVIYLPTQVAEFLTVNDTIYVPQGYRRFFRTNLALECAAAWGVVVSPDLRLAAQESKADVLRANIRLVDLSCGWAGSIFGGATGYDIWADS